MRVISLVPSLTETLVWAGCDVVGRTKFCIHPKTELREVPVLGGTKFVDWEKAPVADLVLFDKEENRKEMADSCPYPWEALHIKSLKDLENALRMLAKPLQNKKLEVLAEELASLLLEPPTPKKNLRELPGILAQGNLEETSKAKKFLYMIWYSPWMAVGADSFVADMLRHLGYGEFFETSLTGYPVLNIEDSQWREHCLLLSSEPYPFHKNRKLLDNLHHPYLVLDGEIYSWFGIRAIQALKKFKN